MNFSALELDVFRRLNFADVPATLVKTRIDTFLNQRHRQILAMPGMEGLRNGTFLLPSVASQAQYALGATVARVRDIFDGTTNQRKLIERSLQWVRTVDPRLASTGVPEAWVPLSFQQVQVQPAAATALWAISTSAGDTSQTVSIETARTGGYRRQESATLNGLTAVQLGTLTDHVEVEKFYLSAAAAGTVTLMTAAAAGTTLATIPIGQISGRYFWIQLWPTPSAVWTFTVDVTRNIFDLVNANDEPLLPEDFHYLLSLGARIDEYEKMADSRRPALLIDWKIGISRLQNYVVNSTDYQIVAGGMEAGRASNLGPWFPSGSGW